VRASGLQSKERRAQWEQKLFENESWDDIGLTGGIKTWKDGGSDRFNGSLDQAWTLSHPSHTQSGTRSCSRPGTANTSSRRGNSTEGYTLSEDGSSTPRVVSRRPRQGHVRGRWTSGRGGSLTTAQGRVTWHFLTPHSTGFAFPLPVKRHPDGNRIWPQHRWEALAFCLRCLSLAGLAWRRKMHRLTLEDGSCGIVPATACVG
jgi:hypothetical protein